MKNYLITNKHALILLTVCIFIANYLVRWPDLSAYLQTPDQTMYLGQSSWYDPYDVNLYVANIQNGKTYGILSLNPVDSQNQQPVPIYLTYTTIGTFTKPLQLPAHFIFHLSAVCTSIILAITLFWFIKQWLPVPQAYYAFIVAYLGGGIGWLLFPDTLLPDISQPHYTLYAALRYPHDGLSLAALLLALQSSYSLVTKGITRTSLITSFIATFIALMIHPFLIGVIGAITTSWIILNWYKSQHSNSLTAILPPVLAFGLYYQIIGRTLTHHPTTVGLQVSSLPSPNLILTLSGVGLLLPFIYIAINKGYKKNSVVQYLTVWFVAQIIIIYLPIPFQRLLIRGFWVVAVLLAATSIDHFQKKFSKQTVKLSLAVFVMLSLLTNWSIMRLTIKNRTNSIWTYAPHSTEEVFQFFRSQSPSEVLALAYMGNLIPAHTPHRVWIGHEFTTPQYNQRLQQTVELYQGKLSPVQVDQLLQTAHIQYILWGPDEQYAAQNPNFPYPQMVESIFQNNDTTIYKRL